MPAIKNIPAPTSTTTQTNNSMKRICDFVKKFINKSTFMCAPDLNIGPRRGKTIQGIRAGGNSMNQS